MKHGKGTSTRDGWCTPKDLADAIGPWDLDPCSNPRSHVRAAKRLSLENDDNGLTYSKFVPDEERVFINPPYSDVPSWVRAYVHTRFCFLLKLDTSTKWFADLFQATGLVCITRKRIAFEPPPGVTASSNQFPHAFFYARAEDATPAILRKCIAWRTR